MPYIDLILQTNHGWFENQSAPVPPDTPFQLAGDLHIGKPAHNVAKIVLDLAEPGGYQAVRPVRQYGYFYAFTREVAEPATVYDWDPDLRLQTTIALSRLVRPTSISFRYAARIHFGDDGTVREAFPAHSKGVDPDSWLPPEENYRDWLITGEFEELKVLFQSYAPSSLPLRVSRALWYHEYAARTYYQEVCWIIVSTALESLLHTDRHHSTRQFTERLPQLAELVGVPISKSEAEAAYDMRSHLSHGNATGRLAPSDAQVYLRLGRVLRAALKRAILDPLFAAIFSDESTVSAKWPIKVGGRAI